MFPDDLRHDPGNQPGVVPVGCAPCSSGTSGVRGEGGERGLLQSAVGKTVTVRVKAFLFPNRVMQESNHSHGLSLNGSGVEGAGGLSCAVHISQ